MSDERFSRVVATVRGAIADVLGEGFAAADPEASFVDCGFDSISLARVAARLSDALKIDIVGPELFANPSVNAVSAFICSSQRTTEETPGEVDDRQLPIGVLERGNPLPLSFAQQRLWFVTRLEERASRAYHVAVALRLEGELDASALRAALDRIVARHESLRTRFVAIDGVPQQQIDPCEVGFALLYQDLRGAQRAQEQVQALAAREASEDFDLAAGPLIRGRLLQVSDLEHVLLITLHHIVADAWSMGVLFRELTTLYGAYREGREDPMPRLGIQYADYALWQQHWLQGGRLRKQREYWQERLAGAPAVLSLPTDRERPATQSYAGASVEVVLEEALSGALKALSRRHDVTLFTTMLASWAALLSRLSGQDEVVIGTPVANRTRTELEGLIGFFVNTLAIRVAVSGAPSIAELLVQVKQHTLAAQANQDIPFEQVVEWVKPERSLGHSPIFQVMLGWQNLREAYEVRLPGLQVEPSGIPTPSAQFDLSISLREVGGVITGSLNYATELFEEATIHRYLGYWKRLLAGMVDDRRAVTELEILSAAERDQLLVQWNRTVAAYASERCIHELFEEQVERTPDAVAVVYEGEQLTYAELNGRANCLAHYLRQERGVGPDDRVAICIARGLQMVVGLLGILKAGGAYVPLDPSYPSERLSYMLADSAPVLLLVDDTGRAVLEASSVPVIDLEVDGDRWTRCSAHNLSVAETGLSSRHLAYVIYTSRPTGELNGVMVEHRGVCNLAGAQIAGFELGESSHVLQFASISCDAFVFELAMTLCRGGQLHLFSSRKILTGELVRGLLEKRHITHVALPPVVAGELPEPRLKDLRTLVVAAEACGERQVRQWAGNCKLVNAYGPTETTVCASMHVCDVREQGAPPIGRPISNTRIYILDRSLQPVPIGVAGEIHIGGAGVARGYLNRPELTAERFVRDPFSADRQARMYKTGDLGRWRADGNLELLGRSDRQVRIRGCRVELGKIEAQLSRHPQVREAVVLLREDEPGEKRLVAYYTTGVQEPSTVESLRAHLERQLPQYMMPAAYVQLERVPLMPDGKVDREALPAPQSQSYGHQEDEGPRGEIERVLAEIWQQLLQADESLARTHYF